MLDNLVIFIANDLLQIGKLTLHLRLELQKKLSIQITLSNFKSYWTKTGELILIKCFWRLAALITGRPQLHCLNLNLLILRLNLNYLSLFVPKLYLVILATCINQINLSDFLLDIILSTWKLIAAILYSYSEFDWCRSTTFVLIF